MLISYALDAGKGGTALDELSERWLGHTPITFKDVTGTGRGAVTFDRVAARPRHRTTPPRTPTSRSASGTR